MNNIKNPLTIERQNTIYDPIVLSKSGNQSGSYVDLELAQEALEMLKLFKSYLILGVSAINSEEVEELINKLTK
jgi:hypothetical protein